MNALLTAITNKISGSALSSYVGGRIYLDEALANVAFPYVVFFIVSSVPEDNFKDKLDETIIQFSLFSSAEGAGEIATMYGHLKSLFDDAALTISGDTHIWMVRQNLTTMTDQLTTLSGASVFKQWSVDYSIMVQN